MGSLAIDASSPASTTSTTSTVTTASFTPPAGALLEISWSGDSVLATNPPTPTITDNRGSHLTYTQRVWHSHADSPAVDGQCAIWTAPVTTSTAMTVSVTNTAGTGIGAAIKVRVWTDSSGGTPGVGVTGKASSTSAASIAQSYTAQATGGWTVIAVCDDDEKGAETAGTGCTMDASGVISANNSYGFARRTTADDVNGSSNTLNVTIPATSTNLSWVWVEIIPVTASSLAVVKPAGSRPRWTAKLRRGKFFERPWPQGQQTQSYPTWTDQAGTRPRWLPKLRRTTWFTTPWPQGTQSRAYPTWIDQAGSRPRWLPKLRRGKFIEPRWPQGQQSQSYPTWTDQSGNRPRWLSKIRRGVFFNPPWPQGNTGTAYPTWQDQSGSRPRWTAKLRRGKFMEPRWPQGQLGSAYPTWTDQAGPRPRWLPRLRRGKFIEPPPSTTPILPPPGWIDPAGPKPRFAAKLRRGHWFEPPWPQGTLTQPFPGFTIQPGNHPRWAAKLRRGKFTEPPWPQGQQSTPFPTWSDPSGNRPRWAAKLRRGQFLNVIPQVVPPTPPGFMQPERRRLYTARRGHFIEPRWPQGQLGQWIPTTMLAAGSRPRWAAKLRRGRFLDLPPVTAAPPIVAPFVMADRRRLFGIRRGHFAEPAWPQGPQGSPYPTWTDQAGSRPRWAPRPRRGHFAEPVWPQGPLGKAPVTFLVSRHQPVRLVRRARFAEPPWVGVVSPVPQSMVSRRRPAVRVPRHGRFDPPWSTSAATPVAFLSSRRVRPGVMRRGKFQTPPLRQGPQTFWTPIIVRGRVSLFRPVRRGVQIAPPWPQGLAPSRTLVTTVSRLYQKWLIGLAAPAWVVSYLRASWTVSELLPATWTVGSLDEKWTTGGLVVTSQSSTSLEYVRATVSAQVNGVAINPTTDTVKMAFMTSALVAPGVSDWKTASWNTVGAQYQIQCLVGPGGAAQLTAGNYYVWVQITDNPEIIVRDVDILKITA